VEPCGANKTSRRKEGSHPMLKCHRNLYDAGMRWQVSPEIFNFVILYDHFPAVRLAFTAYAHLSREHFIPRLRIWYSDVAVSPECAAHADDDIGSANLVILAVHDMEACLEACRRQEEGSGCRRGAHKRALVVIIVDKQSPSLATGTRNNALRVATGKTQPDAFPWRSPASRDKFACPAASEKGVPGITP
jgi:hypothetical protein